MRKSSILAKLLGNQSESNLPIQTASKKETNSQPQKTPLDSDFKRCVLVASLMRDYGIRHVVLSSGTRHLNLVRLFEGNDCFITHKVIDERSAAFYAIGIATKLKEPVAICCTSGTSVSNYLTGVTEAYYQGVPLVVLSADRYPCFVGQLEDQTIEQTSILKNVCKKSVTLPVGEGYLVEWETRRLVSDALLELNHHGSGPVHINVPIQTIKRFPPPSQDLKLIKLRKISRVTLEDSQDIWENVSKKLKSYKRILVIYGQNHPLIDEEREAVESFQKRYNCVFITDHLSNFRNDDTILSFPLLLQCSQETFNNLLYPDLVITVGGRRVSNDPILYKLRGCNKNIEHWRVAEDGLVADPFRRLSVVFECSQKTFFKFFQKNNENLTNDRIYLKAWQSELRKIKESSLPYSQKYAIGQMISNMPKDALLHLAHSNTKRLANMFAFCNHPEVFCNAGTNGIDGSASTFMGHVAVTDQPAFLMIGDLSFFYDMNSIFNKEIKPNIRIFLTNNDGAGLLCDHESPAITHQHHYSAKAYAESLGFYYISAINKEEFDKNLKIFIDMNIDKPIFFEVFT